jgi:hypothetical protein
MRTTTLKGRLGPWGDNEGDTLALTGDVSRDLAAAVERDHPCSESSCDIAVSLEAGAPITAALLLLGATDTDYVERVVALYDVSPDLYIAPDWGVWEEYHTEHGVECEACGAYTYGDDSWSPEQCGNCLADLPAPEDEGGER